MTTTEVLSRRLDRCPDPLAAYAHLTSDGALPGTALFESADRGLSGTRRSLLVLSSALRIELIGPLVVIEAQGANGRAAIARLGGSGSRHELPVPAPAATAQDEESRLRGPSVLDPLRTVLADLAPDRAADRSRLMLVGATSFELMGRFEQDEGDADRRDFLFLVPDLLLDIDHELGRAELVAVAFDTPAGNDLAARMQAIPGRFPAFVAEDAPSGAASTDCDDASFRAQVESARDAIRAGDVYQLVLSRSWQAPCSQPLAGYARLRVANPSPYLFYLRDRETSLFGASPESAVRLDARTRTLDIYPVAGTRRRGRDADEDARLEAELRHDPKESAEHMMLVDLARNDIARVCVPGTRSIPLLLGVDRYAHVMHLVSRVQGELAPDLDALHALRACLNMGTLTGAPKLRASELIRQHEGAPRGYYGGAVGMLDAAGNMDTAITIRAAYVTDGVARVRAGAGIVLDSDPQSEADETRSKARAVLEAVAGAAP